jgi:hypothetical protein
MLKNTETYSPLRLGSHQASALRNELDAIASCELADVLASEYLTDEQMGRLVSYVKAESTDGLLSSAHLRESCDDPRERAAIRRHALQVVKHYS